MRPTSRVDVANTQNDGTNERNQPPCQPAPTITGFAGTHRSFASASRSPGHSASTSAHNRPASAWLARRDINAGRARLRLSRHRHSARAGAKLRPSRHRHSARAEPFPFHVLPFPSVDNPLRCRLGFRDSLRQMPIRWNRRARRKRRIRKLLSLLPLQYVAARATAAA
jgi:hypothetical protein